MTRGTVGIIVGGWTVSLYRVWDWTLEGLSPGCSRSSPRRAPHSQPLSVKGSGQDDRRCLWLSVVSRTGIAHYSWWCGPAEKNVSTWPGSGGCELGTSLLCASLEVCLRAVHVWRALHELYTSSTVSAGCSALNVIVDAASRHVDRRRGIHMCSRAYAEEIQLQSAWTEECFNITATWGSLSVCFYSEVRGTASLPWYKNYCLQTAAAHFVMLFHFGLLKVK